MTGVRKVIAMNSSLPRLIASVALLSACVLTSAMVLAQTTAQKTFATPEDAVKDAGAHMDAVRR